MNDTLRHRVVEVQCDLGDNRPEESDRFILASGYRLTPRLILTSAHAVNRRGAIRVRGRDKKSHIARIARIDGVDLVGDEEQADLAILELEHELSGVRPTKYAAVDVDVRQGEVVKGCWALGYPWFKNRPIGERVEQRFIAQLNGEIPMAETNQADMLTFRVNASPRPLPSTAELLSRSPWQGISGAAVFVADRLLAVITEHQPRSGESSLTITPITHFERLPHPEVWRRALNFDPDELLVLSGQRRITDGARRRWPSKRILLLLAMAVLVLRGDTVRNILPLVSGEPMAVESATGDQQEFLLVAPRFAGA